MFNFRNAKLAREFHLVIFNDIDQWRIISSQ